MKRVLVLLIVVMAASVGLGGRARARRVARDTDPRAALRATLRAGLEEHVGDHLLELTPAPSGLFFARYDVETLIEEPCDFPEPEIRLRLVPAPQPSLVDRWLGIPPPTVGGAGGGVLTFADEEEDQGAGIDADKLVELVEGSCYEDP